MGVLWAPGARAALDLPFPDGLAAMLGANPGGLLAGVAFLRGVAWGHAGLPLPEDKLVRLLGGGLVVIALAAVAGALAVEPWRSAFLAGALFDGLVFAGVVAACARLHAPGDRRRRRRGRLAAQPDLGHHAARGRRHAW